MNGALRRVPSVAVLAALLGCETIATVEPATDSRAYWPTRRDYAAFRAAVPDLLEPNYLPFMVHRLPADDPSGDYLVFCRWSADDMPLRVFVEVPEIPESLQDEFHPTEPAQYVTAVETALARWEEQLEGYVRFERVSAREDAVLELQLVAEPGPEETDRRGLGRISLSDACRVVGVDPDGDRLLVRYSVDRLRVYLADDHGLLSPDQVTAIALHELGHALGMRSHSPIPADLMYEVLRDAVIPEPSTQDVNSFVSLYQIDNGTVFGHVPPGDGGQTEATEAPAPSGPPQLGMAPYVDARLGFQVRPPDGWMRIETRQGMVAIDGVTWDYNASFQVIVHRFSTIEEYLDRFAAYHWSRGRVIRSGFTEVAGKRAFRAELVNFDGRLADQITLIESGDGRLVAVVADCPRDALETYRDWFDAALASLEIWVGPR